jgi:hypothetical protein
MCKTKTIQEIIFDIHKRKNEYLFGNKIDNKECTFKKDDCQVCSFDDALGCPFYYKEDTGVRIQNPMRFVQCYLKHNNGLTNYLEDNEFIVTAPLFRVHNIENGEIYYHNHFWYPFRTKTAYADMPARLNHIEYVTKLTDDLNELRWDITKQRNSVIKNSPIPFSLFKKVENTNYPKDRDVKYIDVCDGYATFMMIYFVIAQRYKYLKNKNDFYSEIEWEFSKENEQLSSYIENNPINQLGLFVFKDNNIFRKSTWKDDLYLLGLIDNQGNNTYKVGLFKKWLNKKNIYSDKSIHHYKNVLLKEVLTFDRRDNMQIRFSSNLKFGLDEKKKKNSKEDFILYPPIHIIVRAFWKTPVRWLFIPMTPKIIKGEVKSTSGIILMMKDVYETTAYGPNYDNERILSRVRNLLPILTVIYSIEKQSLEDYINNERIKIHAEQKRASLRSAIAKVFLRTLSHNIGSHVLSRLISDKDLDLDALLFLLKNDKEGLNDSFENSKE